MRGKMADSVEITIVLTKKDAEKLQILAGGDAAISDYLVAIINQLYREQRIFGEDLPLEELISAAERLAEQKRDYQETARTLQQHLKKLTMSQEELMAEVDHLRTLSAETRQLTRRGKIN